MTPRPPLEPPVRRFARQSVGLALFLATLSGGLSAQTPSDQPRAWQPFDAWFVTWGGGYPDLLSGGATLIIGQYRPGRVPGRGGTVRGAAAAAEIGVGGFSARVGFANLFRYDIGYDGFSFDVVYVRPWNIDWGLQAGDNWVGAGVSGYWGPLRLSGAVLTNASSRTGDLGTSMKIGLLLPLE